MSEREELVLIGKVAGTHGIKGQLRVLIFSGEYDAVNAAGAVILRDPKGRHETYDVVSLVAHGKKALLSLKRFDNINQVLGLVGCDIFLKRDQLPPPAEDEYYWCDLLGLKVVTEDGELLGELADIFNAGSSDIYVVKGGVKEFLIPAIDDVIRHVDIAGGVMTISPLEGLLDL